MFGVYGFLRPFNGHLPLGEGGVATLTKELQFRRSVSIVPPLTNRRASGFNLKICNLLTIACRCTPDPISEANVARCQRDGTRRVLNVSASTQKISPMAAAGFSTTRSIRRRWAEVNGAGVKKIKTECTGGWRYPCPSFSDHSPAGR